MSNNIAKQIMMGSNYWVLNKCLVKYLGLEPAFFLSNLCEADTLFESDEEGWFFQTIDKIQEISGLTRRQQEYSMKVLLDKNLIEYKKKGIPQRRYFRINYNEFLKYLEVHTESKIQIKQSS